MHNVYGVLCVLHYGKELCGFFFCSSPPVQVFVFRWEYGVCKSVWGVAMKVILGSLTVVILSLFRILGHSQKPFLEFGERFFCLSFGEQN